MHKYSFRKYILEAGQEAGKMELVKTPVEKAYLYAQELFAKYGRDLDEELPNFVTNYRFAQVQAGSGTTKRKDMPVIDAKDVRHLQNVLSKGQIDVNNPLGKVTDPSDPFPEGLKGDKAITFLTGGLSIHDGSKADDKVKVEKRRVKVSDLKPIQQQIYFDKSIGPIAEFGVKNSTKFMQSTFFISSADNFIIDGHHRFLASILLDPNLMVQVLSIDLPINKLLPLTLAFGDAVGNKRNK